MPSPYGQKLARSVGLHPALIPARAFLGIHQSRAHRLTAFAVSAISRARLNIDFVNLSTSAGFAGRK